jgi:hypothetical protein
MWVFPLEVYSFEKQAIKKLPLRIASWIVAFQRALGLMLLWSSQTLTPWVAKLKILLPEHI